MTKNGNGMKIYPPNEAGACRDFIKYIHIRLIIIRVLSNKLIKLGTILPACIKSMKNVETEVETKIDLGGKICKDSDSSFIDRLVSFRFALILQKLLEMTTGTVLPLDRRLRALPMSKLESVKVFALSDRLSLEGDLRRSPKALLAIIFLAIRLSI